MKRIKPTQFDSVGAAEVCEDGTTGQKDPPARRAPPSGPIAETPCRPAYYIVADWMPDEHRLFPKRTNDYEVAVGSPAGRRILVRCGNSTFCHQQFLRYDIVKY